MAEQTIISMLREKIREHESKIKSLRTALEALADEKETASAPAAVPEKKTRKRRRRRRKNKAASAVAAPAKAPGKKRGPKKGSRKKNAAGSAGETMEEWVLSQFSDGKPKTNRMLLDLYNKQTGKNLDTNGFSARMSVLKKKGTMKSASKDGLNYNGKTEWFDKGKFKKQYLSKI